MEKSFYTKEFILKEFYTADGTQQNSGHLTKPYLINHGYYDDLLNYYPDSQSISETLYRILNDIDERPVCKVCGKPVSYCRGNRDRGFRKYCSVQCRDTDPEFLKKFSENAKNYFANLTDEMREEINRKKKEGSERYRVKKILKMIKNNEDIQIFCADNGSGFEKYDPYDAELIKIQKLVYNEYLFSDEFFLDLDFHQPKEYKNVTIYEMNSFETAFAELLDSLNIKYVYRYMDFCNPFETDFYLPEYNVGVECNGARWHSGIYSFKRHIMKKYLAEKNSNGHLYFIWEDEMRKCPDKVKDFLLQIKNGEIPQPIYQEDENNICFYATKYERIYDITETGTEPARWIQCFIIDNEPIFKDVDKNIPASKHIKYPDSKYVLTYEDKLKMIHNIEDEYFELEYDEDDDSETIIKSRKRDRSICNEKSAEGPRILKRTLMYVDMLENGYKTYREKVDADLEKYYNSVPFIEEPKLTKEIVKEKLIDKSGRILPWITTEKELRKLGLYHSVISYCLDSESITQTLWMVLNDYTEIPECQVEGCHNKVHWVYNHRKFACGCCTEHSRIISGRWRKGRKREPGTLKWLPRENETEITETKEDSGESQ